MTHRIAVLADIHGNPIALDNVLAAIDTLGGVDQYCLLGDYCGLGYDPLTVLERITRLPNAVYIRGNVDRYVFAGDRPPPYAEDVLADPDKMPILQDVERGFAWTQGYLTPGGWVGWLRDLPLEHRFTLPDGTRVLMVHASPGADYNDGFTMATTDDECRALLGQPDADLVLVGHTHWPTDRIVDDVRIVNPGSVSNVRPPQMCATFAIITADSDGYDVTIYHVPYDIEAVIAKGYAIQYPSAKHLEELHRVGMQAIPAQYALKTTPVSVES